MTATRWPASVRSIDHPSPAPALTRCSAAHLPFRRSSPTHSRLLIRSFTHARARTSFTLESQFSVHHDLAALSAVTVTVAAATSATAAMWWIRSDLCGMFSAGFVSRTSFEDTGVEDARAGVAQQMDKNPAWC